MTEWATKQRCSEKAGCEVARTTPPARLLSRLMTTRGEHLPTADAVTAAAIETGVTALAYARDLMERFHRMLQVRDTDALARGLRTPATACLPHWERASVLILPPSGQP